jgi:molybdenum cofactor synthesis domain-containing protein
MKPFKTLISLDEALSVVMAEARPVSRTETAPLTDALGRVLAEGVISPINVPAFSRAAMDGYAVRAEDTFQAGKHDPAVLTRVEVLYAHSVPQKAIGPGECSEVATGSMLPEGADAVVKVEDTEAEGDRVRVFSPVHPRKHVAEIGEDIEAGATVASTGEVLNPSKVGALAAVGLAEARVYEKPRVAVLSTGDEVAPPGEPLKPGQVYDINTFTLTAAIMDAGGIPVRLPHVPDERKALGRALDEAAGYDLLVFSGGSSVGEKDLVMDILKEKGEVLFHGIAVKPGKPTVLGRVDGTPVLGMPGYPTSCLSNAYMILAPMLRKMARLKPRAENAVRLTLGRRIVSTIGRTEFYTVRVEGDTAVPAFKESGAITSMADADGYIMIPANVDMVEKGDAVDVVLF